MNYDYWLLLQLESEDDAVYLITQQGLKQLIPALGRLVYKQYLRLDQMVLDFLKAENEATKQQLHQNQIEFSNARKTGYIYGFKHIKYGTIDYVGSTEKLLKERRNTHIKTMLDLQKIPFYKLLTSQAFQNYETVFLERVVYHDKNDLLVREHFYQEQF